MAKDYDPKKVTLNLGGHIAQGFAEGTFITVARNNDMWTLQSGASGETARSKSNDRSGTIEVTLMQTSITNDYLASKAALDESDLNGGKFAAGLMDANGTTLVGAVELWVKQQPSMELAKELSDRTWMLETGDLEMFVGGTA
ncbi:MAG: DUF3277 family protein [Betaproteobacteria bacterium]|nr:MAG: DUF3277 family protein [Betaproteobacteria bacterium]